MGSDYRMQSAFQEAGVHNLQRIRVALAADHPIIQYGLRELLNPQVDMEVVGDSARGLDTLRILTHADADILIVDLQVSESAVSAVLDLLRHARQKVKIVVLSASEDKNELIQALKLGCSGVVLKRSASENILACIRRVYEGGIWVDCQARLSMPSQVSTRGKESRTARIEQRLFSAREREILALVAQGLTNPEIAKRLFVSLHTVRNHLHHMYSKIGVTDRIELVLYAIHEGIQRAPECNRPIHRIVRRRRPSIDENSPT